MPRRPHSGALFSDLTGEGYGQAGATDEGLRLLAEALPTLVNNTGGAFLRGRNASAPGVCCCKLGTNIQRWRTTCRTGPL